MLWQLLIVYITLNHSCQFWGWLGYSQCQFITMIFSNQQSLSLIIETSLYRIINLHEFAFLLSSGKPFIILELSPRNWPSVISFVRWVIRLKKGVRHHHLATSLLDFWYEQYPLHSRKSIYQTPWLRLLFEMSLYHNPLQVEGKCPIADNTDLVKL